MSNLVQNLSEDFLLEIAGKFVYSKNFRGRKEVRSYGPDNGLCNIDYVYLMSGNRLMDTG